MSNLHSRLQEANNTLLALRGKLRKESKPGPKRDRLLKKISDCLEEILEIEDEIRKRLSN